MAVVVVLDAKLSKETKAMGILDVFILESCRIRKAEALAGR